MACEKETLWHHERTKTARDLKRKLAEACPKALMLDENHRSEVVGAVLGEELDGPFEAWYETGRRRASGRYAQGRRVGTWTCWDPEGERSLTASYDDGYMAFINGHEVVKQNGPESNETWNSTALFDRNDFSAFFAQASTPNAEPRRAICLTLAIALACIWGGDLNALAIVVTMFFLLSYGAMNYATFVEGFSRNPSFRPRFRLTGWRTSLSGAIVCASVMFARGLPVRLLL